LNLNSVIIKKEKNQESTTTLSVYGHLDADITTPRDVGIIETQGGHNSSAQETEPSLFVLQEQTFGPTESSAMLDDENGKKELFKWS
jgi:hypothetical protein